MKLSFTPYIHSISAFREVEDFLSRSYANINPPRNWLIDRWNFTATVSRVMHKTEIAEWEKAIGLWRDGEGRIVAIALEEEQKGDVFFQFLHPEYFSDDMFNRMFDFAEGHCCKKRGDKEGFALRIPQGHTELELMAAARGYKKLAWSEPMSMRPVRIAGDNESNPPPGALNFIAGIDVSPEKKAWAHARAFGYCDTHPEYVPFSILAFQELLRAPSYRPEFDLALATEKGEIVSFVGLWIDKVNAYGILEPVGTIPEYRRKGLASWLINEGERRLARYNVKHLYVGSDQDFYRAIGFNVVIKQDLWEYLSPDA